MKNRNLVMTCLLIAVLAFGSILLTSLTTPQSKPTLTRTSGGFGSNLSVYEYKASDGSIYVIVQGNGGTGPVAVHSK